MIRYITTNVKTNVKIIKFSFSANSSNYGIFPSYLNAKAKVESHTQVRPFPHDDDLGPISLRGSSDPLEVSTEQILQSGNVWECLCGPDRKKYCGVNHPMLTKKWTSADRNPW